MHVQPLHQLSMLSPLLQAILATLPGTVALVSVVDCAGVRFSNSGSTHPTISPPTPLCTSVHLRRLCLAAVLHPTIFVLSTHSRAPCTHPRTCSAVSCVRRP
uniref:Putative spermidine synthase n=1 Tax=Lygus hesperus TaxID=30085 RepID=A0A0A9WM11_LYGHE